MTSNSERIETAETIGKEDAADGIPIRDPASLFAIMGYLSPRNSQEEISCYRAYQRGFRRA